MSELSVQALIDAGAHIGCRVSRWNPKMEPYIFEARNRIHVIDLRQTIRGILRARHFLREVVGSGQDVLFVGTKRQLRRQIVQVHQDCGMPYVDDRWIGGTLTNYEVIGSRIAYLEDLEKKEQEGYLQQLTKKEGARFQREKRKVDRNLHGIREMFRLPGALVVVDPKTEKIAVREARRCGIPVIGVVDTDCDPDPCDLVIPANDDAIRSVGLILEQLAEAVNEGKRLRQERGVTEPRVPLAPVEGDDQPPVPRPRRDAKKRPGGGVNRPVEIQAMPEEGGEAAKPAPSGDDAEGSQPSGPDEKKDGGADPGSSGET